MQQNIRLLASIALTSFLVGLTSLSAGFTGAFGFLADSASSEVTDVAQTPFVAMGIFFLCLTIVLLTVVMDKIQKKH